MNAENTREVRADTEIIDGVAVVHLKGDLGHTTRDVLQATFSRLIDHEAHSALIVDITQVRYLASYAVAETGYYYKMLNDRGGYLALVLNNDQLLKPFRLAGLCDVIPIFHSIDEALAAMRAQGIG